MGGCRRGAWRFQAWPAYRLATLGRATRGVAASQGKRARGLTFSRRSFLQGRAGQSAGGGPICLVLNRRRLPLGQASRAAFGLPVWRSCFGKSASVGLI